MIYSFSDMAAASTAIIFTEANMFCLLFVDGKSMIILLYVNVFYSNI